jgi:hypothetical protein
MKHAFSVATILLAAGLAGCADEPVQEPHAFTFTRWGAPHEETPLARTEVPLATGSLPVSAAQEKREQGFQLSREQLLRNERRVYAQGLEKILVANGVKMSVVVYEGPVEPTPSLMFHGYFSKDFVSRALTNGAVLVRAKELGFKSVDFFDRGPDGHYQFVLSKSAPLPKCAAYQRLCL